MSIKVATGAMLLAGLLGAGAARAQQPHNVILFVADGLRSRMVDESSAPTMAALARNGVFLRNSHSLFPTFTTANASAIATGHYLGDTGDFSNVIYTGFQVAAANQSVTPFLENDAVLGEVDGHFKGDYLDQSTILQMARERGYGTAAVGKLGPVLIMDHAERTGEKTIVVDDATGSATGIPLSAEVQERLRAAGLPVAAPGRGANGVAGDAQKPGTTVANVVQQDYFASVATRVVLPMLAAKKQPFVMLFWSRDPDGSQHNQGDSLGRLVPGINGPTSLAAIRNADDDLARLLAAVQQLGIADTTDIVVTADHGFSTISKESQSSAAAQAQYADVPAGKLPVGFVAIDLARGLGMTLFDPDVGYAEIGAGKHPKSGNGVIGADKDHPKVVVAANGGSDLVYVPDGDRDVAAKVVELLMKQDYVSGLFVDRKLGSFPGTLTLDDIGLEGSAVTPVPAIAVNFRSFDTVCGEPVRCTVEVADTALQQGQGMHGSFSRADTWNFMAVSGPDFRAGYVDDVPTSNADVGRTIAKLLGLTVSDKGKLVGRVMTEALRDGVAPAVQSRTVVSAPGPGGLRTVVNMQVVGTTRYFDAAGFAGRTVGLAAGGD